MRSWDEEAAVETWGAETVKGMDRGRVRPRCDTLVHRGAAGVVIAAVAMNEPAVATVGAWAPVGSTCLSVKCYRFVVSTLIITTRPYPFGLGLAPVPAGGVSS